MAGYGFDDAYATLMSPSPWLQSSGSVGWRNFAAAAQQTAIQLRQHGAAAADGGGSSGAATQEQAEAHAQWFDQVASNATTAADHMDAVAKDGLGHQATAESMQASYKQAVTRATAAPIPSGEDDMAIIHSLNSGTQVMNQSIDEWHSSYNTFSPPTAPPVPGGSRSGGSGGPGPGTTGGSSGSTGGTGATASSTGGPLLAVAPGSTGSSRSTLSKNTPTQEQVPVNFPPPGTPGSVQVGSGSEFSGWFVDPRTGFYIDPKTGREFDPATSRWVDPVTGKPFGDVTQYASRLEGLGGASTTGGLLSGTAGGGAGGAGGFSALIAGGGDSGLIAGAYGGTTPPSLLAGNPASGALWQQAGSSLANKQTVAERMLAREQAARAGRPYLPPTQAGAGAGGAGSRTNRPSYLIAEPDEQGLFSTSGARRSGTAGGVEEQTSLFGRRGTPTAGSAEGEQALFNGQRTAGGFEPEGEQVGAGAGRGAYLPPTQTGAGKDDERTQRPRPEWVTDEDVFTTGADTGTGVIGE